MSKEKNKNTFRIGALLLVACLISSVMLSGTFAKYTSEYAGEDTALVARWSLDIKEGDDHGFALAPDEAATLDLFGHTYSTNMLNADGHPIIAPGVDGDFVLYLANNSDVAADITFDIDKTGVSVPMEFSIVDNFLTTADILTDYEELEEALNDSAIHLDQSGGSSDDTNITVYWRWAYNGATATAGATDDTDTTLGTDSNTSYSDAAGTRDSYTLTIKVTATQAAPGPANFNMNPITVDGTNLTVGSLSGGTANYQWQRSDSINGTYSNIGIGNAYVIVASDEGKYIRVIATGTGENRGTVISAPVGPIEAAEED
jgi:hypothetical protein